MTSAGKVKDSARLTWLLKHAYMQCQSAELEAGVFQPTYRDLRTRADIDAAMSPKRKRLLSIIEDAAETGQNTPKEIIRRVYPGWNSTLHPDFSKTLRALCAVLGMDMTV